jgi:predicted DNA binding protein
VLEAILECPQPHSWIALASDKYSAKIEILDSKMLANGIVEHLFDIQVRPELADEVLVTIRNDKDVIEMEVMKSNSGHLYGAATSRRCTVCKEVAKSKCFLASVGIGSGNRARWTVLGKADSFGELVESLEKKCIPVEVKSRRTLEDSDLLTTRQEQLLSIAFERGYFDFPKKIGLEELASLVGIRASTLAEILRRGQRKIVGEYLARRLLLHRNRE